MHAGRARDCLRQTPSSMWPGRGTWRSRAAPTHSTGRQARGRSSTPTRVFAVAHVFLLSAVLVVAPAGRGQDQRIPSGPEIAVRAIVEGLTAPVYLTEPDDGSGRRFVVDQAGQIRIVTADDRLLEEPFLDLSDAIVRLNPIYDERGLLGLAFDPDYRENGRFYVYYSARLRDEAPDGWNHTSRLSEFRVSDDDPNRADPDSERIMLAVDQPYANHNGGHIAFGPDGYLYVPLGDGGNGNDADAEGDELGRPPIGWAQTLTTLLGKILRIDVHGDRPYEIPEDNPFVGDEEARGEIWAYGFRNPWGFSFDLETGDIYAADAGQALFEEIDRVEKGGNYGWNFKEGTHCFDRDNRLEPPAECRGTGHRGEPLIDPVIEYQRGPETGSSITEGVLYRGSRVPALTGKMVFGDYGAIRFLPQGILYAATPGEGLWELERIRIANALDGRADGDLHRFILAVTQDLDGDLYVLTTRRGGPAGSTGQVLAIEPAEAASQAAGLEWWWWLVIAGGALVVLLGALAVWDSRRRRTVAPAR